MKTIKVIAQVEENEPSVIGTIKFDTWRELLAEIDDLSQQVKNQILNSDAVLGISVDA